MNLKRINNGNRMSDVVIHNGVAYLSDKVPTNPGAGITEQTQDVLATIEKLLGEAGSGKDWISERRTISPTSRILAR